MFEGIAHAWRIRKIERRKRKVAGLFDKDIALARHQKKDQYEIQSLIDQKWYELSEYDGEIASLESGRLVLTVRKYRLVPPASSDWVEDEKWGYRFLTTEATVRLTKEIRAEKNERWDTRLRWLGPVTVLITAIAGLLGVITGFLTIWKN